MKKKRKVKSKKFATTALWKPVAIKWLGRYESAWRQGCEWDLFLPTAGGGV
jgi:hypothetical protein